MQAILGVAKAIYPELQIRGLHVIETNYRSMKVHAQIPLSVLDNGKPLLDAVRYGMHEIELQDIEIDGEKVKLGYCPAANLLFIGRGAVNG